MTPKNTIASLSAPECPNFSGKLSPEFQAKYLIKSNPQSNPHMMQREKFDWTRLSKDCDIDIVYSTFPIIQNAGAFKLPSYEDFLNQKVRPILAQIHRFHANPTDDEVKNFVHATEHLDQLLQADSRVDHSEVVKLCLDNLLDFYNPKNTRLYQAAKAIESFLLTSEYQNYMTFMSQKLEELEVQNKDPSSPKQPINEEEQNLIFDRYQEHMQREKNYLDRLDPFQFRNIPIVRIAALRTALLKEFENMKDHHEKLDHDHFLATLKLLKTFATYAQYPIVMQQYFPGKSKTAQTASMKTETLKMVQESIAFVTPELLATLGEKDDSHTSASEIRSELQAIQSILSARK
jgi:hypothetical protein